MNEAPNTAERAIGRVRGTREWMPADHAGLRELESLLLDRFGRAGYEPMRTPVLEYTELHERKSGAAIVSKLLELPAGECLRPELTAGIVRAYAEASPPPALPWRVSMSGLVVRQPPPRADRDREFTQVGVELIGADGPAADAEVIGLADWALRETGIPDATVRIGHVGIILEILGRSGLPPVATSALVEVLSEAAGEGRNVEALQAALDRLTGWLRTGEEQAEAIVPAVRPSDDRGVDRLFRHLVPDVIGRRTGHEIIGRLRRKWDLGHSLHEVLGPLRGQHAALASLRGPAREVLGALGRSFGDLAPESIAALGSTVHLLEHLGTDPRRVELDLGFGRGIGFYTRMIFELVVPMPDGPIEVCGGGRYDGLARVLGSDRDDRGVGFAFGLERLASILESRGRVRREAARPGLLIACGASDGKQAEAFRMATFVRSRGG